MLEQIMIYCGRITGSTCAGIDSDEGSAAGNAMRWRVRSRGSWLCLNLTRVAQSTQPEEWQASQRKRSETVTDLVSVRCSCSLLFDEHEGRQYVDSPLARR